MKTKLFFSICLMSILSISVFSQSKTATSVNQDSEISKQISWDVTNYDFGSIKQNNAAEAEFVLTNTSKVPITIARVKSSCGCTVTGYDRTPVLPGQESSITATYNAKKLGAFRKTLTVFLSDNSQQRLTIKGSVDAVNIVSEK